MKCNECGTENHEKSQFCQECGEKIDKANITKIESSREEKHINKEIKLLSILLIIIGAILAIINSLYGYVMADSFFTLGFYGIIYIAMGVLLFLKSSKILMLIIGTLSIIIGLFTAFMGLIVGIAILYYYYKSTKLSTGKLQGDKEKLAENNVNKLIKDLKYKYDSDIRSKAAVALGDLGDRRAVEPLIQALNDEDEEVRWEAADALGKIRDERAVDPLIRALNDEHEDVRSSAAEALNEIDGERKWNRSNQPDKS